jgi:hypothetical protein
LRVGNRLAGFVQVIEQQRDLFVVGHDAPVITVAVLGLLLAWRSRSETLLTEIRDVLVDIRDEFR